VLSVDPRPHPNARRYKTEYWASPEGALRGVKTVAQAREDRQRPYVRRLLQVSFLRYKVVDLAAWDHHNPFGIAVAGLGFAARISIGSM